MKPHKAKIVFAAHDIGGANMLVPIIPVCREAGDEIICCARGPACDAWGQSEHIEASESNIARLLDNFNPQLVVTGTSLFASFERLFWKHARSRGIVTLAVVDAWINIRERFLSDGKLLQPDVICVIDDQLKQKLIAQSWCTSYVEYIGHPHLECFVQRIKEQRTKRIETKNHSIVFISEPIAEHYGRNKVGYDQYSVVELLSQALCELKIKRLIIKPHPSENLDTWQTLLDEMEYTAKLDLVITQETIQKLLVDADLVLGMASMVLIEAVMSQIPVLAIQPGRRQDINPILHERWDIDVVTDVPEINTMVKALIEQPYIAKPLFDVYKGSKQRLFSLIQQSLSDGTSKAAQV